MKEISQVPWAENRAACQFLAALCPVCFAMLYRNSCIYQKVTAICQAEFLWVALLCSVSFGKATPDPQAPGRRFIEFKYLQHSKYSKLETKYLRVVLPKKDFKNLPSWLGCLPGVPHAGQTPDLHSMYVTYTGYWEEDWGLGIWARARRIRIPFILPTSSPTQLGGHG